MVRRQPDVLGGRSWRVHILWEIKNYNVIRPKYKQEGKYNYVDFTQRTDRGGAGDGPHVGEPQGFRAGRREKGRRYHRRHRQPHSVARYHGDDRRRRADHQPASL
ncbi:hypothetical protein CHELA40_12228 [Chelatococcus asaccharovorans]|nr:hypothetical protein CHELA40_12228 [Chelatococcus asaccharovorans]CAH1683197.1 hypothetical protein CHELA17_63379 [Chelatococcus asaccharovorans]